jgi:hypothetical protein
MQKTEVDPNDFFAAVFISDVVCLSVLLLLGYFPKDL